MTWVEITRAVLVGVAFLMPAAFCVCYHVWTGGHWRDSRYGVHLMVFSLACALILLYAFLAVIGLIPRAWLPYSSVVIYPVIAGLFLWRLLLLWRDHRRVDSGATGVGRP
jgi:hypothetical protein